MRSMIPLLIVAVCAVAACTTEKAAEPSRTATPARIAPLVADAATATIAPLPTATPRPAPTLPPPPPPTLAPQRLAPAAPPPAPASNCSPSYPGVCIPPGPPDLDCGDVSFRRFRVLPPDPHGFDREGDGLGCESG